MTIKEAIVKVLELNKKSLTYLEVYDEIIRNKFYVFKNSKTPTDTIGALCGSFIRDGDKRVKRVQGERGFEYYLSKYEDEIKLPKVASLDSKDKGANIRKSFLERDLHKLLSTYLNTQNIYSKTIFHEKSSNNDSHKQWIHPDMIGIKLLNLRNKSSQALMKVVNRSDSFELNSYELKKEIKSDYDLKKYYFQAVSNSSWANYGYLVAFEISSNLMVEIERLNRSFGIGVIELNSNPYKSEILFPAKMNELDYWTIDKLAMLNTDFEKFIEQTETILTALPKYMKGVESEFVKFCDDFLNTDSEVEKYCTLKNIPNKNTM